MKKMTLQIFSACFFLLLVGNKLSAQREPINAQLVEAIRKEGLENSQVMEVAAWLTDVHGPRLTGSPKLDDATKWAKSTLEKWGMSNVHLEEWGPFGRGWQLSHFSMHALTPTYFPIIAVPKAWSGSTKGEITGEVIYLNANDSIDLLAYKGKLKGKFILLDTIRDLKEWFNAPAERHSDAALLQMAQAPLPGGRPERDYSRMGGFSFNNQLWKFISDEKPAAVLDRGFKGDLGVVFATGARVTTGRAQDVDNPVIPQATLSVEHYNRILRMVNRNMPVSLSLNLLGTYTNPDGMEHNLIAEIPGSDKADEVVMLGAHIDSWHNGTGATDNAAGSAVMMEALRIIQEVTKATGIKPRRTIRLALWTGEEQGLLGSRAYVKNHFGETPEGDAKRAKISAYYNLDNGTGKIRGIYTQGNEKIAPIFNSLLQPFKDLGAATVTYSNTGGTDHQSFDGVGIPGFQFIQEPIAYSNRTHHSNMDNWDHLIADDLKQAATVIASIVLHTAMRDELMPRK
jgi:hypothetical protein